MKHGNDEDIILKGQSTYSEDMKAFMLNERKMVIYGKDNQLVYLTKEQVMKAFNLVEPKKD